MIAFHRILVPVDFGASSKKALQAAIELSKRFESSLTLLHTLEVPAYGYASMEFNPIDMLGPLEDAARKQLSTLLAEVQEQRAKATSHFATGSPWQQIMHAIETTAPDLVVMGTHGREGIKRHLLGSVAEKIVRMSLVPVLTVRGEPAS
jgi:nucleotide-binding universal stress UspA family protein